MNVQQRLDIERKVVRKLIRVAKARGWTPVRVDCGDTLTTSPLESDILDAVFSVDESVVRFRKDGVRGVHCAVIILGNDGYDCIADASSSPEWDEVTEEVWDYCETLETK